MNIALWIARVPLAVAAVGSGAMRNVASIDGRLGGLDASVPWGRFPQAPIEAR